MKKLGFGTRMLSALLVLAMVLTMAAPALPRAQAVGFANRDDTGLNEGGLDTKDTISWPIKIFDYNNDGMLFEFAQTSHDDIINNGTDGTSNPIIKNAAYYGGGQPVPKMSVGTDYTLGATYNMYAYKNWGNTSASAYSRHYDSNPTEVSRTIVQPVKDVSPMYLHLSYDYPIKNNTKSYVWVSDFSKDNGEYYNENEVRYAVVVYKTNEKYAEMSNGIGRAMRPFWAVDDSDYVNAADITKLNSSFGWSKSGSKTGILVGHEQRVAPSTDRWTYFVMDMKSNHVTDDGEADYGIQGNWDKIQSRVAGIGFSMPICVQGEEMDISHIAYFGSSKEAQEFGKNAVAFNNDPGEYLGNTYTATYSTTNGPDDQALVDPNAPTVSANGSDFVSVPKSSWDEPFASWGNSGTGMTIAQLTDTTTKRNYMQVGSADAEDDSMEFFSGRMSRDAGRFITIVYRTNFTPDTKSGFNVKDTDGTQVGLYRNSAYKNTFANTNGQWSTYIYDIKGSLDVVRDEDYNYLGTINYIKWWFPGLNTSEKIDIAYVDYFSTVDAAQSFGDEAVAYMNGTSAGTGSGGGSTGGESGGTTVTNPVERPDSSNNALDFSYDGCNGYNDSAYATWTYDAFNTWLGGLTTEKRVQETVDEKTRTFVRVSSTDNYNEAVLTFMSDSNEVSKADARYVTLVYRTKGFTQNKQISFWVQSAKDPRYPAANMYVGPTQYNNIAYITANYPDAAQTFRMSENEWTFLTFDLNKLALGDSDYNRITSFSRIGMYLPGLNTSEQLEIAAIDYYSSESAAANFGSQMAQYMNRKTVTTTTGGSSGGSSGGTSSGSVIELPGTGSVSTTVIKTGTATKGWNMGDNQAFGMLRASNGGGWNADNVTGGENANPAGYFSFQVGELVTEDASLANTQREKMGFDAPIFLINMYDFGSSTTLKGYTYTDSKTESLDTSYLAQNGYDLGYTLHTTYTEGLATVGLVSHTLDDNKRPVYRDETVDYIALMLYDTLRIPKTDTSGNYNYGYVKGQESTVYGTVNGKAVDLATALRNQLGITFASNKNYGDSATAKPAFGDAAKLTDDQKKELIGSFGTCVGKIDSYTEAAYYLLHNLYVDNSYNQRQTDYNYLVLPKGNVTVNGKDAYVFDGGFTYEDENGNFVSAVNYDRQKGVVSLNYPSTGITVYKDQVYYQGTSTTTRYPFLPVTDATGDFAGRTVCPYIVDDGARGVTVEGDTYVDRNYNFAMAANGEFVYHYEDALFFEFEGDDDVYLFVNGELVLDIGAGHSITKVEMNMNDYIDNAKAYLTKYGMYEKGYYDGMSNADFAKLLETVTIPADTTAEKLMRAHKLNLQDASSYAFDFYYMERKGWGSNCRIATNIVITDPATQTRKTAYQNETEVEYAGVINPELLTEYGFSLTNGGNSKLYNISFKDSNIGVTIDPKQGLVTHGTPVMESFDTTSDTTSDTASATTLTVTGLKGAVNLDGKAYFVSTDGTFSWQEGTESKTAASLPLADGHHTLTMYQVNAIVTDKISPAQNATVTYGGTSKVFSIPGIRVCDANGKTLNASDLKFTVSGYYDEAKTQPTGDIQIVIDDDADLMRFLQTLQSDEGTQTGEKESLFGGAGLWRHATLSVRGMYYTLTEEQKQAQVFDNTVFTTATPSMNSTTVKKGQASHRVYTENAIKYYQWADHNMFVSYQRILNEAGPNSVGEGSQLHEYADFFASLKSGDAYSLSGVNVALCDKKGTVQKTVEGVTLGTDKDGTAGLITRYKDAGVYHLYLLMYTGTTPTLEQGKHAIISITIYVPYVADSVFVLDYGLTTAHLDAGGELFKNDKLFGIDGTNVAKFMGLSTQVPSYLDPVETSGTQYNAINFIKQDQNVFNTEDGYYTMTFKPGTSGKTITYSTVTGQYSLTDAGTAKVTAMVPQDWENAYIYYWYDDYTDNGWPGFAMNKKAAGEFELDIAGDVTNIVINNGSDQQTVNLKMTSGMESLVTVKSETNGDGKLSAEVTSNVQKITVSAKVPGDWDDVFAYCWIDGTSVNNGWPGTRLTLQNGWYTGTIPSGQYNRIIINNGDGKGKQTLDLTVTPGRDVWITVPGGDANSRNHIIAQLPDGWGEPYLYYWDGSGNNDWPGEKMQWMEGGKVRLDIPANITNYIINNNNDRKTGDLSKPGGHSVVLKVNDDNTVEIQNSNYSASVSYSAEYFTVYTKVPGDWGTPYLYYWFSDGTTTNLYWPGNKMTQGSDGWYSLQVPAGVTHMLVDNGYRDVNDPNHKQTVNLEVEEGADAWITVTDSTKTTYDQNGENPMVKHLATITEPGLTFSPSNFMDSQYDLYIAMSVHDVDAKNIALDKTVDVAEEAQMYKKISVLPATVVYYEDDFPAIHYIQEAGDDVNVFEDLGSEGGSGGLSQDVDQDTEYGSDPSYDSNSDMSGNTTKKVTIRKAGDIAYFTFTGTGFELISRTNADRYATVSLSVYKAEDVENGVPKQNATRLQFIPVVTEFDQGGDGGTEVIYQVPVIRVNDLVKGSYTVIISGSPSRDWGNKYPGNDWNPSNPTALPEIIDSYLYIDGLRIYQPMGAENDNYSDNENGATFAELRKLVVDGYAALASYDGDALTVGSGTNTWLENRNGEIRDGEIEMGFTQVNKVDDYLIKGPNNEVYVHGSLNNSAIVFYVKEEEGAKVHNLQIAVHAMDQGLFLGAGSTGMSSEIYYGVKTDDGFGWEPLVTTTGATEQYYTVDYTKCPVDANGYYQVAVKANTGMASFTSLKYNGLLINSMIGTPASMRYVNGVLQVKNAATETWEPATVGEMPMFLSMRSQLMAPVGSDTEDDPVVPSEPAPEVTVQISSATLSLEEETFVNLYLTGENLETLAPEGFGLLTWSAEPGQATVETAENNFPGGVFDAKGRVMVRTGGIPAKMLGDDIYLRAYAKTADGTYIYTQLMRYSPKMYAMSRLEKSDDDQLKALCVALLNYGAQAQKYFGYRTDALMNADLTAQQQALVSGYTDDMVTPVAKADEAKAGVFVNNQGFRKRTASVSLDGVFAINYYFTPAKAVEGSVTFYCWSAETYEGATALTAQNATAAVTMEPADNGAYFAKVDGIAAKDFDEPVYVAAVYEAEGQTQCTGIIAYSLSGYFAGRVQKDSGQLKDLSAAAAVYGFYAKNYFVK